MNNGVGEGAHAWAMVLAGGKGMGLRGLTRHVYGEDRPKQYAVLTGGTSLLRQTLDRVSLRIPAERTVVVTMAGQRSYMTAELGHASPAPHVLEQPSDRGTAAAVLLAAHWILARDPEAVMVALPSDHFVADDTQFMGRVADVVEAIGDHPEQIADALFRMGALWNTFVFGGRAATLVDAGRECLPALHDRLVRLDQFRGTEHERWAMAQAYECAPRASFSRDVLERCPTKLAAMRLSAMSWCDLGTSRRVIKTLGELGIQPAWLATLQEIVEGHESSLEPGADPILV